MYSCRLRFLPKGTVETFVKPENKAGLTGILFYHAISGKLDWKELAMKIQAGKESAKLATNWDVIPVIDPVVLPKQTHIQLIINP